MNNFTDEFYNGKVVNLVAIDPLGKRPTSAKGFRDHSEADSWAKQSNEAGNNIYFLVNGANVLSKKAKKEDIQFIYAAYIDLDPEKDKEREAERIRLQQLIKRLALKPSAILDSGNGYAVYWYYEMPMESNTMTIELSERINKRLAEMTGGDNVQNIDRIMRYPDTINYPTPTKLRAGYTNCNSKTVQINKNKYTPEQLLEWLDKDSPVEITKPTRKGRKPEKKLKVLLAQDEKVKLVWNGHPTDTQEDTSRSGFDMTLVALLKGRGLNEKEVSYALETFKYGKMLEAKDPEAYVRKLWDNTKVDQPLVFRIGADGLVSRYAYIKDQNKFFDGKSGIFLSSEALNSAHLKEYPGGRHSPKASESFFMSEDAIITDTVTWIPNGDKVIKEHGAVRLNMYIQPTMMPSKDDAKMWLEHVEYIVPNEEQREHLLDWMAFTLQKPELKINHQVLMAGNPRVGKDLMFLPMTEYFGHHNVAHPQAEQMHGTFNEFLNGKKLIMVEEIMNFEKRSYENQLKPLCAAPPKHLHVNSKGMKQYEIPNLISLVFFSNEHDAISIRTKGDTRYFCLWCDATRRDDKYYIDLMAWYESGGYEASVGWLMERDISKFNCGGGAPETDYRREIGAMSITDHEMLITETIAQHEGVFAHDLVTAKQVVEEFKDYGIKSVKRAGMMLKRAGAHKYECVYRDNEKTKKVYVWAIRDHEKYKSLKPAELHDVFSNQF